MSEYESKKRKAYWYMKALFKDCEEYKDRCANATEYSKNDKRVN